MIEAKNTLKEFGLFLRLSNQTHQTALRQQLAERTLPETPVTKSIPFKHLLFIGAWSMAAAMVILATRPGHPISFTDSREPVLDVLTGVSGSSAAALRAPHPLINLEEVSDVFVAPNKTRNDDIVDYEKEHGQMLDTSIGISLMTTKKDVPTQVSAIFTGLGGHVNKVTSRSSDRQSITGFVPSESYPLFKSQMQNLARADRYIFETLNAKDLIPSAMSLDEQLEEVRQSIDALEKEIARAPDEKTKVTLTGELANLQTKLEGLHTTRSDIDDTAAYVSVTVSVTQIPTFWKARNVDDFKSLVAGFEDPSFFQRLWINALAVTFFFLQVFSLTFWLIIPFCIWLAIRTRERRAWQELA